MTYAWGEYLLHNPEQGYRWISEYNGHFNLIKASTDTPRTASGPPARARYLGRDVQALPDLRRHGELRRRRVLLAGHRRRAVQGRRLRRAAAHPLAASGPTSELGWSLGEYTEPAAAVEGVRAQDDAAAQVGIAPNQPSPHAGRAPLLAVVRGLRDARARGASRPALRSRTSKVLRRAGLRVHAPARAHVSTPRPCSRCADRGRHRSRSRLPPTSRTTGCIST